MEATYEQFATWLDGFLDANGIPVKTVAAKRGVDPSNFSKKTNSRQALPAKEYFLMGVAAEQARAETQKIETRKSQRVNAG